jgi:AraC-like DNA-binding protein
MLKSIHLLTGMTVTLYNSYRMWVTSYPLYNRDVCKLLRHNKDYHARCRVSDSEAFELCTQKRDAIVYRCYMGLYEILVPLYDQDNLCGYLMLGQALEDSDEARCQCKELVSEAIPDVTEDVLRTAIDSTFTMSKEKLMAAVQLAKIYAEYICEKNLIKNEVSSLANLVTTYIREHLTEKITNTELCYVFLCDRKKLTSEFKKLHGMTIVEYVNNLRLRRAREMLQRNPDLTISYVSSEAGFSYQSYFCTQFYKKYGMSPTEMQRKYKEEQKNNSQQGEKI